MDTRLQTCRLCHDSQFDNIHLHKYPLVRYGVRASVHADCGLKRWGKDFFMRLSTDRLKKFPAMAAVKFDLMKELTDEIERRKHMNYMAQGAYHSIGTF